MSATAGLPAFDRQRGVDLGRAGRQVCRIHARPHVAGVVKRQARRYRADGQHVSRSVSSHAAPVVVGRLPIPSDLVHGRLPDPALVWPALVDLRPEPASKRRLLLCHSSALRSSFGLALSQEARVAEPVATVRSIWMAGSPLPVFLLLGSPVAFLAVPTTVEVIGVRLVVRMVLRAVSLAAGNISRRPSPNIHPVRDGFQMLGANTGPVTAEVVQVEPLAYGAGMKDVRGPMGENPLALTAQDHAVALALPRTAPLPTLSTAVHLGPEAFQESR